MPAVLWELVLHMRSRINPWCRPSSRARPLVFNLRFPGVLLWNWHVKVGPCLEGMLGMAGAHGSRWWYEINGRLLYILVISSFVLLYFTNLRMLPQGIAHLLHTAVCSHIGFNWDHLFVDLPVTYFQLSDITSTDLLLFWLRYVLCFGARGKSATPHQLPRYWTLTFPTAAL